MFKAKRILALALTLIMMLALLAGCNTGAADAAQREKILLFGTTGIDGSFASVMANNQYDLYVSKLVFDPLVDNDAKGLYHGILATYELSEDKHTYTFTLKDGITFSDGTPMTTADVAFTYKTICHPDYNGPRSYVVSDFLGYDEYRAGETTDLPGINIINEKTIEFTFKNGTASPANIACFIYGIMPEHYYAFTDFNDFLDLNEKPMGSGRFLFDEFRHKEFVKLSTNENHWNKDRTPKIGGILMSEVPRESMLDAFAAGQLHLGQPDTNQDNVNAYNAMDGVSTQIFLGNGYTYLDFNTLQPQLSDFRVRQALMYALDRASFIEAIYGDLASVGLAPISPASWAFPAEGMNDYAFDLDKAAELMDEAGWLVGADGIREKDGMKMAISWLVYTDAEWPGRLSEMAYDSWRNIGVDLTIELMDFTTVIARTMDTPIPERDHFIYSMGFGLDIDPDPSGALFDHDAFVEGGFNTSGFYHARSQELIAMGKQEFDQAKRTEIYHEWAKLMNEQIATIIIAYRNELWVVSDKVKGVELDTYWDWTYGIHSVTIVD